MQIIFEFTTKYGVFRDALYLDDEHTLSDSEVNALKQERLDNWIKIIESPPTPEPEIVEIDGTFYEKIELNEQVVLKPIED